jgi:hypothetical protein
MKHGANAQPMRGAVEQRQTRIESRFGSQAQVSRHGAPRVQLGRGCEDHGLWEARRAAGVQEGLDGVRSYAGASFLGGRSFGKVQTGEELG